MRRFSAEDLRCWKGSGFTHVVTTDLGTGAGGAARFLVEGFESESDAAAFVSKALKGIDYLTQHHYVKYSITDEEVSDMVTGVFGCEFYIEDKN